MSTNRLILFLTTLAKEPPFRIFMRPLVKAFPTSIRTKANWNAVARPHYLVGVLYAAEQAIREGLPEICVIEFGVARGSGLLALQEYAAAVEKETGVKIQVYGFDFAGGLPRVDGDYRDHPDQWKKGDYKMDEEWLRQRLSRRTSLVLGDVKYTVPQFVEKMQPTPVGFISVDVDLYSSTKDVFRFFQSPGRKMLRRVAMYFDDVQFAFNHRFAGELLAIDEFNQESAGVKIDRWRGVAKEKVFPESAWLESMYVAHDLEAISKVSLARPPADMVD
jgi:hypothetical protein